MSGRLYHGSAVSRLAAYFEADKGGAGASGSADNPTPEKDADGGGQQPEGDGEKKFSQADFDAALKRALDQKEERARKAADAAKTEQERKEAEAAGKWEEVNKQLTAENERLKTEKADLERRQLQTKVATEAGLPLPLADRLKGESEEEMTADAKSILALLPKTEDAKRTPLGNPSNPPAKGRASDADADKAAKEAQATMIRSRI